MLAVCLGVLTLLYEANSTASNPPDTSYDLWDYNSISSSPTCNTSAVFQDASMIMTLAERLNMTRFTEKSHLSG